MHYHHPFSPILHGIILQTSCLVLPAIALATDGIPVSAIEKSNMVALIAIAHMVSVLIIKLTAFIIGYKIAKLGYETLVKGISGQIDFGFQGGTVSAKLKSASPGSFFVLLGAAIIAWGLFVEKPFHTELFDTTGKPIESIQPSQQAGSTPVGTSKLPGMK